MVAAAEGPDDAGLVLAAAARLGIPDAALHEAESTGLIRTEGGALAFRHPILRTAIYQGAGLPARLAVHRALADELTDERDADRAPGTGPLLSCTTTTPSPTNSNRRRSGRSAGAVTPRRPRRYVAPPISAPARRETARHYRLIAHEVRPGTDVIPHETLYLV